jgi:hypothetical protein
MPKPLKTKKARLDRERRERQARERKNRRARNLRRLRGAGIDRDKFVLVHTWITNSDTLSGVCPECDEMDGVQIVDGDEFDIETVDGDPWPPVHPNCVCEISSEWVPR